MRPRAAKAKANHNSHPVSPHEKMFNSAKTKDKNVNKKQAQLSLNANSANFRAGLA